MDGLIPWEELEERIRPFPNAGRGRRECRIHCVQLFYNLSDPGMEDCSTRSTVRRFVGLRLGPLPDETTILNFRHLLEERVGLRPNYLESTPVPRVSVFRRGRWDASIIAAPS